MGLSRDSERGESSHLFEDKVVAINNSTSLISLKILAGFFLWFRMI